MRRSRSELVSLGGTIAESTFINGYAGLDTRAGSVWNPAGDVCIALNPAFAVRPSSDTTGWPTPFVRRAMGSR